MRTTLTTVSSSKASKRPANDGQGKIMIVRYEAVNTMLLNEFLKDHQKVQELKKQVAKLTAGLQKVSAQLQLIKPAPQTVLNNH